ncbi:MAG TPA: nucleotide sugar dehydrogenase [Candidatus Babeliales bacterium]|nr:nucleotide sugar dehydrogenase [Candidatus Babeliales bacterium]
MKKICVVGLGYIGLPTSIVAAQAGFQVVGYDIDVQRVERINNYDPVIEEPEIFEKLGAALKSGLFRATATIEQADCFIIAVPTPFHEDKTADVNYVWSAGSNIASVLKKGDTVILESTVPVGTTDRLARLLSQQSGLQAGVDFFVSHCPERVLPGNIFRELVSNARIIGGINPESIETSKQFYKKFVVGPLYLTNAATAEMVKLVENSSRDVQIAFANQVAGMAYSMNLNPFEVIELANKHPRVSILNPSCGVGGHCIAVDPWFLIETFPEHTALLKMAREVNDQKPEAVVHQVKREVVRWKLMHQRPCKVLILGLSYKPDIDDMRESPAVHIAEALAKEQLELMICEPHISPSSVTKLINAQVVTLAQGLGQADIVLCLVKHRIFKSIDKETLASKIVLDTCGLFYEPHKEQGQEQMYWPASNAFYRMYGKDGL